MLLRKIVLVLVYLNLYNRLCLVMKVEGQNNAYSIPNTFSNTDNNRFYFIALYCAERPA